MTYQVAPRKTEENFMSFMSTHFQPCFTLSRLASGSISERNLTAGWLENILKCRITHRFTPELEYREFTPENCQFLRTRVLRSLY